MESQDCPQSRAPGEKAADSITSSWNREPLLVGADAQQQRPAPRRVCAACRRRKVGCDKKQPCQNCKKSNSECVYPPDGKSAAQQVDPELWEHLRRLEPMFKSLVDRIDQHGSLFNPPSPSVTSSTASAAPQARRPPPVSSQEGRGRPPPAPVPPTPPHSVDSSSTIPHGGGLQAPVAEAHTDHDTDIALPVGDSSVARAPSRAQLQQRSPRRGGAAPAPAPAASPPVLLKASAATPPAWSPYGATAGKLVRDNGRRRYVNGMFWETLHSENNDSDSGEGVDTDDDDLEDHDAQPCSSRPVQSSFLYSLLFEACAVRRGGDLAAFHPPPHHRFRAWQLFKENVHPVVTVLHVPSVEPVLMEYMGREDVSSNSIPAPLEALMFVVYFGAAISLTQDDCESQFGCPQSELLARLRAGIDEALAAAGLMDTDDMLTLQTFVIYLALLRSHDPTSSWNLTGLAARLAQSLGMHRDGSNFALPPFDAELRRRLWWTICILDAPASEDYSCSPSLLELSSFDARLPLNINDADLHPNLTEYPPERRGLTDMSFTVARCWVSDLWRTMIDTRRTDPTTGKSFRSMTVAEKERWVDTQRDRIREKVSGGNQASGEPLQCLIDAFIGTIFCNLQLFIHNPLAQQGTAPSSEEQRRRVFREAIDCMVHSYRLRTDPRAARWSWLTRCYNEWHALAVVLAELCDRPLAKDADRAWRVVEQNAVLRWESAVSHRRLHQWRSVMRTIERARRRRRKELGRRHAQLSAPGGIARPALLSSRDNGSGEGAGMGQPQGDHYQDAGTASSWDHDAFSFGNFVDSEMLVDPQMFSPTHMEALLSMQREEPANAHG
ncbi:C6 transcription factor [Pleurostoma richardsiae]|uniref:C6 transcription factor n=1 Tax=Pleurostoma richardsiae TaxID=41990 RepID=A0AA38RFC6_9PEZI|nr:C6 transcription factor [Pleurostoma richardsiae]